MNSLLRFLKFWVYWQDLFYEIRTFIKINKVVRDPEVQQRWQDCEYTLRYNWFGTPYTVVNIDDPYIETDEQKEHYVREAIKHINDFFVRDGLSNYLTIHVDELIVNDENGDPVEGRAYLVKFPMLKEAMKPWPLLLNILKLGFITEIIIILINLFSQTDIEFLLKYLTL